MKSTEKNKIKWSRVIRPMAMSLVLVFLLSYATFAWLKRDWTPTLTQENVKIVAGSSLTFVYVDKQNPNGYVIEKTPVNTLLGISNFEFQSVSSSTGRSNDFFGLVYGSSKIFDVYNHLDVDLSVDNDNSQDYIDAYGNPYTALGMNNGYIEMKFKVSTDIINPVGIYLDHGSVIEGATTDKNGNAFSEEQIARNNKAANAMRVSVTVHGALDSYDYNTNDMDYIFSNSDAVHQGITARFIDSIGYEADRKYQRDEKTYLADQQNIVALSKTSTDSFLFNLSPDDNVRDVTVRIWLEGTDEDCDEAISDAELNIFLKFTAGDPVGIGS